jgi:amino acid adenylation domain-containing protein
MSAQKHSAKDFINRIAALSPEQRALLIERLPPLSFGQQRLWFFDQMEPESALNVIVLPVRLQGPLEVSALERSLSEVVRRHEILRTCFPVFDGRPVQLVLPAQPLALPLRDLTPLPPAEREAEVRRLIVEEVKRGFNLHDGPVIRGQLLRLGMEDHVVLLAVHHIVFDGWSTGILIREVSALYDAYARGTPPPLGELKLQYGDYARWQRQWLQGDLVARQLEYWRKQLADLPPLLELPTDYARPAAQSFNGGHETVELDRELCDALRTLSRNENATLFMTMLAGLQTLLYRYTGQPDIPIGSPIAGRADASTESLLGFFVNTIVLRAKPSGGISFKELLESVREMALEAHAHQDLPFEWLVEALQPERNLSYAPLFQAMFALQNAPIRAAQLPGLMMSILEYETDKTQGFDLTLILIESERGLVGTFEYDSDIFEAGTIKRMVGHFTTLLRNVTADPGRKLADIDFLSQAERDQLLLDWNRTTTAYPNDAVFHTLFEAQVARNPEATAVVCMGRRLSYAQLNERANRLARILVERNVGPEAVVALLAERGIDMLTAIIAVFKAGGAYLPLDPASPVARLAQMIEQSRTPLVLVASDFDQIIARVNQSLPDDGRPQVAPIALAASSEGPAGNLPPRGLPENLAYVIYTSGSTGAPKGAMIEQRGMINHLYAKIDGLALTSDDVIAQTASQCFDISVWQFLVALLVGGRVEIFPDEIAHDGLRLLEATEESEVTILESVPSLLQTILDERESERLGALHLARLRWMIMTGEALPPDLCRRWFARYPRTPLLNAYGPTECSDDVTHHMIFEPLAESMAQTPIGRPIINTQLYVLDENLSVVARGCRGELYVGGDGVGRGYLHDGGRTAEVFIPDHLSGKPCARLYRTGDLARYLPDGTIQYLGRVDNQVKVRGFRIELGEIETVLNDHPQVRETIVLDHESNSDGKSLVAYVVPNLDRLSLEQSDERRQEALEEKQVERWLAVYNDVYREQAFSSQDEALNLRVWVNSYTGQPFPEEEIFESVDDAARRILSLNPSRVLEIGCGTGLILFRVAPYCALYWGTDISPEALHVLRERLKRSERSLPEINLLTRAADDFEGLPSESFDVVVINEVAQYLPSGDYLRRVIEGAVKFVRPGGAIFIGGVRSLPLFEAFHASVQLAQSSASQSVMQFRQQAQRRMIQEKEFLFDPEFFLALQKRLPQISHVNFELKGGRHRNEFTKYRYDVILNIGASPHMATEVIWRDWREDGLTLSDLSQTLRQAGPDLLCVTNVPNARLLEDLALLRLLDHFDGTGTVGALRGALREVVTDTEGIDPADLWDWQRDLPYAVSINWSERESGCFDVIFSRRDRYPAPYSFAPVLRRREITPRPWSQYTNDPMRWMLVDRLGPQLREFLRERVPDYMVPSAFIFLPQMPLTPNGKLDRRALPAPDFIPSEVSDTAQAPRSATEEIIADIWAEVLGRPQIGRQENFFALGGHSLLATQALSRVRAVWRLELPLRAIFEAPTVESLARQVEFAQRSGRHAALRSPIRPVDRSQPLPLSFAQQRLWFLDQLEPGSSLYNIPVALRLNGDLRLAALESALSDVARRHEALRTRFVVIDEQLQQQIMPPAPVSVTLHDLSGAPAEEREEAARRIMATEAGAPFDLSAGRLMRVAAVRLAEEEHIVLVTMSHIISDGWSMGVLVGEVAALYTAHVEGQPAPLNELAAQYADYAVWQRAWLDGEGMEGEVAYWRKQLEGAPPLLELPTDRPRPAVQTFRGGREGFEIGAEAREGLRRVGRREEATLFMVLLAAFKALLWRYTGQEDLLVGTPVAGRTSAELEGLIGFFVNTLVLRDRIRPEEKYSELVRRVRETSLNAYARQEAPFEKLVEELNPPRDLSYSPLFQVAFGLQNAPLPNVDLPGLTLSPIDVDADSSKFDMTLFMMDAGARLFGTVEYNSDLFERSTIRRLIGHYQRLLEAVASHPATPVMALPLLSEAEQNQLLVEWNDTAVAYPRHLCLHELFEAQAARSPENIALVYAGEQLSYRELNGRSNQLARVLKGLGVGPESRVALLVERSLDAVIGILGILKAGGAYVPLDPQSPPERLAFMIEDAEAAVALAQSSLLETLPPVSSNVVSFDRMWERIAAEDPTDLPCAATPENMAYMIYTSGTTGRPKAVMVEHRNLVNTIACSAARFDLNATDVMPCLASFAFDISLFELFTPLMVGGKVVIYPQWSMLEMREFTRSLQTMTMLHAVPSLMRQIVDLRRKGESDANHELAGEEVFGQAGAVSYERLRRVFVGGDWVPLELLEQMRDVFPRADIHVLYGPTEGTIICTCYDAPRGPKLERNLIGRPLGNARLRVLDRNSHTVPVGVAGEIWLGGDGVARGYLKREEMTRDKFVMLDGERYYRTGDLGRYLADGNIEFLGRADEQVKVRGFRIELGEIETLLVDHPGVREAVALAVEDETREKHLEAYLVAESEPAPTGAELRQFLQAKVPEYMVPSKFVVLDALPLNPNGKVNRRALVEQGGRRLEVGIEYVAPTTVLEKEIAGVWREALKVERVGLNDNFFALGGHSLLLVQMVRKLQTVLQRNLSVVDLFRYPSVGALTEYLTQQDRDEPSLERATERARRQKQALTQNRRRLTKDGAAN